jgi:serine/threonine protein kinase
MGDFHLSVLSGAMGDGTDESAFQDLLRDALRESGQGERWQVTGSNPLWCSLQPCDAACPKQGWKLHVSATPVSAGAVLERALPILLAGTSGFKFARTPVHVAELNGRHTPRGHSGKFLTVYPSSDEEAVRLAAQLHEATDGLPGPRVLSDRPYLPGSIVHYRYGAFVEERRISNDGMYSWVIFDPDGNPVEDMRVGQYLPPSWARCPFPEPAMSRPAGQAGESQASEEQASDERGVLVGDRFLVREAVQHANKGGVYWAVDSRTGGDAVLKEARPHVAVDQAGHDVRDLLRAEARALQALDQDAVAPRLLATFEQSGHFFLAEERVPGMSLRLWVLDRLRAGGWRRSIPDALGMAERLAALLDVAHLAGLVLRDFTPNNIMVRPDEELRLIDLELAVHPESDSWTAGGVGTPGFAALEQIQGAPPTVAADLYSLGADICFLLTGAVPDLLEDVPASRPRRERLAEWLEVRRNPDLPELLVELILGLMEPDPADRWTTADAHEALRRASAPDLVARPTSEPEPPRLDDRVWQETVDGLIEHLLDTMDPADGDRLWPVSCVNGSPDPCIVQLGAAGILGVLTQAFELTGDARLPEAIGAASRWLGQRIGPDHERPPGLYFGQAGVAWALYEAGRALGDEALQARALEVAAALPTSSPNPDITHGTAGIGMALLHLGGRAGREDLLARAGQAADVLVASPMPDTDELLWGTPAAFESRLAGGLFYGFAHGTAGIASFLLATGRPDCVDFARQAGETLLASASVSEGLVQWGTGPETETTAPYWCHGSAGIGSFLTRLYRVTGDDHFDKLAQMSARAVIENSSRGVLGQCHGLAGNGEFLMDLAETGDREHNEALATEVARILLAGRARQGDQVVFPNEDGEASPAWADGSSGILSFLLRLRYRSPRMWVAEPARGDLR